MSHRGGGRLREPAAHAHAFACVRGRLAVPADMLRLLSTACALAPSASARPADVHEQRKPWVPLMLEATYRPTGWLGIMCVELSLPPAALLPYV